jgi:hypothetical protein
MVNRSKIVIDVEPFIYIPIFHVEVMQQAACRTEAAVERPRQLSAANAGLRAAPHRVVSKR